MTVLRSSLPAHVTLPFSPPPLFSSAAFVFTFCQDRFRSPPSCFPFLFFNPHVELLFLLPFLPRLLLLLHALLPVSSSFWYLSVLASCSPDVALTPPAVSIAPLERAQVKTTRSERKGVAAHLRTSGSSKLDAMLTGRRQRSQRRPVPLKGHVGSRKGHVDPR